MKAGRFAPICSTALGIHHQRAALREMGDDRLVLLAHFCRLYADQAQVRPFALDAGAEAMVAYAFPGNVRELRNIVIRLTAKYPGGPSVGGTRRRTRRGRRTVSPPAGAALAASDPKYHQGGRPAPAPARPGIDLDAALALWERGYIEAALQLSNGNVSQAARRLGINRTTLYNRGRGGRG